VPHPHLTPIGDVTAAPDGSTVTISGHIAQIHPRNAAHGHPWAQLTLTDSSGTIAVYVFPQHYAHAGPLITHGAGLVVTGRLNRPPHEDAHLYGYDLRGPGETGHRAADEPKRSTSARRVDDVWAQEFGLGGDMAAVKGRRHRTGVSEQIPLRVRVSPENYEKARLAAEALGVSMTTYVDHLLSLDQLDEQGRPNSWGGSPAPRDQEPLPFDLAEEAPLKSA
jgi:DNA polymerase III alpha subunit